jgi:hypothetical protein
MLIFAASAWEHNRSASKSFCFMMGKRMFEAIIITAIVLIISGVAALLCAIYWSSLSGNQSLPWDFLTKTLWQTVFPIMTGSFCPIFTLYSFRTERFDTEAHNKTHTPFEKFVENAFVYSMEMLALVLLLCYAKQLVGIITAIVTPRYTNWGRINSTLALFIWSIPLLLVASAPAVQSGYPKLKILPIAKKWFPIAWFILACFSAIKMVGFETVLCLTDRCWTVWLAWFVVVYAVIVWRIDWSKTMAFSATMLAGTLLFFESQINNAENRVFAFLEQEQFLKDGVIAKKAKMSKDLHFKLAQCIKWLTQHEDVIISRLGKVVTESDGKQYFLIKTSEGEVRKDMKNIRYIWEEFGGDSTSGGYVETKYFLAIPLRFPFRGS